MSYVKKAHFKLNTQMPDFVHSQLQYEVIMGSVAYAVNSDNSDLDIYGFCIPPKSVVFPHVTGNYIFGYDGVPNNFEQWQKHHVANPDNEQTLDFCIYNITKFFRLCADGNPNMIDSLFVPLRCVVNETQIGNRIREARKMFLSKKCWHTFKGYAYSQMHKMKTKVYKEDGKRKETFEQQQSRRQKALLYGYDVKFAYHVVRLLNEVEQILTEGDLDLERNREQLKEIRRGSWTQKEVEEYFQTKEKDLESVMLKSDLPHSPQRDKIRKLLWECLEMHFADTDLEPNDDTRLLKGLYQDLMILTTKYQNKVKL